MLIDRKSTFQRLLVMSFALFWGTAVWPQAREIAGAQSPEEMISLTEAEIIIYLLPQAKEVRRLRGEISWELEAGPSQNTRDFYTFWVVGPKRQGEASNTVGYFSVNKHTADVWNSVSGQQVSDEEIRGVQRILREGHHIDKPILDRYRALRP